LAILITPPLDVRGVPRQRSEQSRTGRAVALLAFFALVAALYLARQILVPVMLAVVLSFLVTPLVDLLQRLRLPLAFAVIVSVTIPLALVVSVAAIIGSQIAGLGGDIPAYERTIQNKWEAIQRSTLGRFGGMSGSAGKVLEQVAGTPVATPGPPQQSVAPAKEKTQLGLPVPVEVRERPATPWQILLKFLSSVLAPLETTGVVFIVSIFVLLQREMLRDRLIRLMGSTDLHRTTTALDEAAGKLTRYFVAQLCVNTAVGVVVGIGLSVAGTPSPLLWGVLTAVLRFVPYVGVWIAALLAIAFAAAVDPGWSLSLWSAAIFLVTELAVAQAVEPLLYGRSTGMSPLAVILSALFWGWIWGPIGLILSTPLTLCLVVLGRYVEGLEFLDVLLGEGPVLTPEHSFYQRVLLGDSDTAVEDADAFLETHSLTAYYDGVAVPGLRLAMIDMARGAMTHAEITRIIESTEEIIDSLETVSGHDADGQDDENSPTPLAGAETLRAAPGEGGGAALDASALALVCIPGAGPVDTLATRMLVQLLHRAGVAARQIAAADLSRTKAPPFDFQSATGICVLSLDPKRSISAMRTLARRLTGQLPKLTVIAGLWSSTEAHHSGHALHVHAYGSTLEELIARAREIVNGRLATPSVTERAG
jgi:predicted PurR-regulated permease PerM